MLMILLLLAEMILFVSTTYLTGCAVVHKHILHDDKGSGIYLVFAFASSMLFIICTFALLTQSISISLLAMLTAGS